MIPASARGRLGLLAILAVFLVPISVSWLGGLTQAVTCDDRARSTLAVSTTEKGDPIVLGSTTVTRKEKPLCGRLVLETETRVRPDGDLRLRLGLRNKSAQAWRGTVRVAFDENAPVDVAVGRVDAGETVWRLIPFDPPDGQTEIPLEVLVGP